MEELWTESKKYHFWAQVEANVMRAQNEDSEWWRVAGMKFDDEAINRIKEIESHTQHDVAAFVDYIHAFLAIDTPHFGLTSSDVVDTALALQMTRALGILRQKAGPLDVPLHWLNEATAEIRYGTLSGPVGSYSSVTPEIEKLALGWMGLKPEPAPTQVVARDRYAYMMSCLALTASVIVRTINSVYDEYVDYQESVELRRWVMISLQNVSLWHERDISHSSTERILIPEAFKAVARLLTLLEKSKQPGDQPS